MAVITCDKCKAWEPHRRHPSEHTGECRLHAPSWHLEQLAFKDEPRAKWPITFANEWCMEGVNKEWVE